DHPPHTAHQKRRPGELQCLGLPRGIRKWRDGQLPDRSLPEWKERELSVEGRWRRFGLQLRRPFFREQVQRAQPRDQGGWFVALPGGNLRGRRGGNRTETHLRQAL